MSDPLQVYIGYDGRQHQAFITCAQSIEKHASVPVGVEPISRQSVGLSYNRGVAYEAIQQYDVDGEGKCWPVSTDFAMARFWVPLVRQFKGWALFVDADFLFMDDVAKIFAKADDRYAVMCCQPFVDQEDEPRIKMDGRLQVPYERKRWSALMLWNCGHPANKTLRSQFLNLQPFLTLHQFRWLKDEEIGRLDDRWQWVHEEPRSVHYTRGLPTLFEHASHPYAGAWINYMRGNPNAEHVEEAAQPHGSGGA